MIETDSAILNLVEKSHWAECNQSRNKILLNMDNGDRIWPVIWA